MPAEIQVFHDRVCVRVARYLLFESFAGWALVSVALVFRMFALTRDWLTRKVASIFDSPDLRIQGPEPLTVGECHDHFKRTLAGPKWEVVKGLHTLRRSVASCPAAAGVDQRIIDDMLGHVSEEMRRRYRHLTPAAKAQAVAKVLG